MNGTTEKTIISAQMPTTVRDRLRHLADTNERSLSGEVRRAIDTYLRFADTDFSRGPSSPLESPVHAMTGPGEGRAGALRRFPSAARREDTE